MKQFPRQRPNAKRRAALHAHRRRTGVSLSELLKGCADAPDGLGAEQMALFYRGENEAIASEHFDYLVRRWEAVPDRKLKSPAGRKAKGAKRRPKIEITPDIRAELRRHWLRVGLSIAQFFKRLESPPPRLSARMIWRWTSDDGPTRARADHLEFVLAEWRRLPGGIGRLKSTHFIPFSLKDGDRDGLSP